MRRPRTGGGTRAVLLAVLLLAGCGVPVDEQPRAVEPPFGPPAAPTVSTPAGRVAQEFCLVRGDRLVRVVRQVDDPGGVDVQLRRLLAGPTAAERHAGLGTALPGALSATGARLVDGRAEVDVAPSEVDSGRSDEVLAYGQIVCTLDGRSDVAGVSFLLRGRPLGVPRADGSLSSGPLTAADYTALTSPN
ncbi:GerMN domain-containing protein [Micromonospora sp. NPDC092111]|uniref:GerMN domain-containing protein n=1 Tax=Micromonospora sp. NPDC092111 TaxID=3364289 RepID=UPI0038199C72